MNAKRKATELDALMDLRVRTRNLAEGLITADEVQRYLDALPDDEEQGEWVDLPPIDPSATEQIGKNSIADDDGEELLG